MKEPYFTLLGRPANAHTIPADRPVHAEGIQGSIRLR
jgi:hypothetical protein